MLRVCPQCRRRYEGDLEYCEVDGELLAATLVGQVLHDRYRVDAYLGGGGMGDVYRVHDLRLGRDVALKVMRREVLHDPRLVQRFRQEALAVAALRNEHTVTLYDCETEAMLYFTMELVEGKSLGRVLEGGLLGVERSLAIADQICESLEEAHERGIIHRDLKPDNIMMVERGGADFAKVLDFGVAKVAGGFGAGTLSTASGMVFGTVAYMSPEQAEGKPVTPATDQYALGVILFEMLAGKPAFQALTPAELMVHHMRTPAPLVSEVSPQLGVPLRVDVLLQRLLAKAPCGRFGSMTEVRNALRELSRTASNPAPSASEVTPSPTLAKKGAISGGRRLWLGLAAGTLALGMLGLLVAALSQNESLPTPSQIQQDLPLRVPDTEGQKTAELEESAKRERQRAEDAENKAAAVAEEKLRLETQLELERWAALEQARALQDEGRKKEDERQKAEEKRRKEEEAARLAEQQKLDEKARKETEEVRRKEEAAPEGPAGVVWVLSEPAKLNFTRTEVTVAQFRACLEAGACKAATFRGIKEFHACNWGYPDRDDHPMNCVNWQGAKDFCAWVGGRLPSEEEWYTEASNGGTRKYPWGEEEVSCDRAVWDAGVKADGRGCGMKRTWPVCSKPSGNSVSGLCDMSGNVAEWTSFEYEKKVVLRGGSWELERSEDLMAYGTGNASPAGKLVSGGIRCVREPLDGQLQPQ